MITTLKEFKIYEKLSVPVIKYITPNDNLSYSTINASDIELEEDFEQNDKIYFNVIINNQIETGIDFYIQVINNELYHPHITVHKDLRNKGIAKAVYEKFITEFGNLYTSDGRRTNNNEIPKIYEYLVNKGIVTKINTTISGGTLYIYNEHPDIDYFINKYSG